jgi:hypothetical protein
MIVKQFPDSDIAKGKMVINQCQGFRRDTNRSETRKVERQHWEPPAGDTAKLNVDGAFTMDGRAGIGMVLRNCHGEVLYAACQQVHHCSDALEAELMAIEMGATSVTVDTASLYRGVGLLGGGQPDQESKPQHLGICV